MFTGESSFEYDYSRQRSTTPRNLLTSSGSFSNLMGSRSITPNRNACKSFTRSTAFDATLDLSAREMGLKSPVAIQESLRSSPVKLRESRTFSSTVFLPPQQADLKSSAHKPKDHGKEDLFGSEKVEYSRKNTVLGFEPNFTPKYKEINPAPVYKELLEREIVTPRSKVKAEKPITPKVNENTPITPKPKKLVLLPNRYNSVETPRERLNVVTNEINSVEKFDVLGAKNTFDLTNEFKREIPTTYIEPKKATEDLGRPSSSRLIRHKENQDAQSSSVILTKSRARTPNSSEKIYFINPKERKLQELNQSSIAYVKDENKLEELEITGLKGKDDERTIKDLCQGCHVISIAPKYDNITGECTGSATLTLRSQPQYNSVENLRLNCVQKGLQLKERKKPVGKRNNYAELSTRTFLDSLIKEETKRLTAKYGTPKGPRPDLVSSADVYGSTPGVGRVQLQTPIRTDKSREVFDT